MIIQHLPVCITLIIVITNTRKNVRYGGKEYVPCDHTNLGSNTT